MATATAPTHYLSEEDNKSLNHIPGDYSWPWFGKAVSIMNDLYNVTDQHYKKYGEISRIRMGGQNGLLVVGPENYQKILIDKDRNYSAKMGYDKTLGSLYPETILLSDFDDHKVLRRMFQSAFKNDAMKQYMVRINHIVKTHIESLDNKQEVLFFPFIKSCLMDVALNVFFGIEDLENDRADELTHAFFDANDGLLALVRKEIPGGKFHKGKKGIETIHNFLRDIIKERRGREGTDTMTYLCNELDEDGNYFSDDMIIKQAAFLLFAAHDTTTSAITHMVLYTAKDKHWQQQMYQQSSDFNCAEIEYAHLNQMENVDHVFHEALRLNPSVPMLSRRTINDCKLGDYHVPANTVIWIPPCYNHRMPEFWSKPDEFDPLRFAAPRNEHKSHSFAYVPFGGGAHKCIGMHFAAMVAKTFMHQFMLSYEYKTQEGYDPKMLFMPLPKPADDLPISIKKR